MQAPQDGQDSDAYTAPNNTLFKTQASRPTSAFDDFDDNRSIYDTYSWSDATKSTLKGGSVDQPSFRDVSWTVGDTTKHNIEGATSPGSSPSPPPMSMPTADPSAPPIPSTQKRRTRQVQPSGRSGYYGSMQYHAEKLSVSEEQLDDWLQGRTDTQFDSAFASRLDSKPEHKGYLTSLRDQLTGKSDPSPEEQLGTLFDHLSMVTGQRFPRGDF